MPVAEACSRTGDACPSRGSSNERLDRAEGHPLGSASAPASQIFASVTSAKNQAMRWAPGRRVASAQDGLKKPLGPATIKSESRLGLEQLKARRDGLEDGPGGS